MIFWKYKFTTLFSLIILGLGLLFLIHQTVAYSAKDKVYTDTKDIPTNRVGLLLGTSKFVRGNWINLYYKYRLEATQKLYKAGKIDYVLISGDHGRKEYNEPQMFKDDLVKAGISAEKIYLDYAGFRTLDSVVRCKEIFGQSEITIISQKFHNERAVFIAQQKGINAIAYNARSVSRRYGWKVQVREVLARTNMMLDLFLFNKQPKFLGEKIIIS